MDAVRYLVRLELRQRWMWLVALMLVIGFAGSGVIALAVGANRTDTAVKRLFATSNAADAIVYGYQRGVDLNALKQVPGVADVARFPFADLPFEGIDAEYTTWIPDNPEVGRTLENGPVIRGRMFDPDAVNEVVVDEAFVASTGLDVGDTGTVQLPTKDEQLRAIEGDTGGGKMTGPRFTLTIVGVQRTPLTAIDESGADGNLTATPALLKKYDANLTVDGVIPSAAVVWFAPGTSVEALTPFAQANNLVAAPTERRAKSVIGAARLQSNALRAVSGIVALAALILIGLLVGREMGVSMDRSARLRGLGVSRRDRVGVAVGCISVAALFGAAMSILGAYLLSSRFPVGVAEALEPTPGRLWSSPVLLGAAVTFLFVAVSALLAGLRAVRAGGGPTVTQARSWRVPMPLTTHLAVQSAVAPSRQMRPGVLLLWAGSATAILGLVGSITLASGIEDLSTNPRAWGQVFDATLQFEVDDEARSAQFLSAAREDPDVERIWDVRSSDIESVSNGPLTVVGPTEPDEAVTSVVLAGRLPKAPDEVAVAPAALDRLEVELGEQIRLKTPSGDKPLTVVGVALMDTETARAFDDGALVTGRGFEAVVAGPPGFRAGLVQLKPGVDSAAWVEGTMRSDAFFVGPMERPSGVGNVLRIKNTPYLLAGLLALLAAAAAALGLATQARASAAGHAVFRALGLRRRQSFSVLPQSSTIVAVLSALIFVPLGIVLGRWIWRWLCDTQNFYYVAPEVGAQIAGLVTIVVAVAVLLSLLPAWSLSRINSAQVLRRE